MASLHSSGRVRAGLLIPRLSIASWLGCVHVLGSMAKSSHVHGGCQTPYWEGPGRRVEAAGG